jgi:hypothetical protein
MARMHECQNIPDPPSWLELSHLPDKNLKQAVVWCQRDAKITNITERYLRNATDAGELKCRIIAGQRRYSTRDLYDFILTRPSGTAGRGKPKQQEENL